MPQHINISILERTSSTHHRGSVVVKAVELQRPALRWDGEFRVLIVGAAEDKLSASFRIQTKFKPSIFLFPHISYYNVMNNLSQPFFLGPCFSLQHRASTNNALSSMAALASHTNWECALQFAGLWPIQQERSKVRTSLSCPDLRKTFGEFCFLTVT